jgi:hypothetical protein
MKVKELKLSLQKVPGDMDDLEVIIIYADENNKRCFDLLAFTGYIPNDGSESLILGTLSEIQRMVEAKECPEPPGYIKPKKK